MKNIAVILAGCGRMDGSEVQESILTLLSINQNNANYQCFSIDGLQHHVTNHLTNSNTTEKRNMLIESARIARGDVKSILTLNENDFDALVIPGGNGITYNLFTLSIDDANFKVNEELQNIAKQFTKKKKPVGFICIAPMMIPKIYDEESFGKIELTLGTDSEAIKLVESLGALHFKCKANEIHVDIKHKIISTPAYMLASNILEAYEGIKKLIDKTIELS